MDRKDLENLILEMACIAIEGERRAFTGYFNINYIDIDYTLENGRAYVFLIDNGEKTLLKELDFKEAVLAWRNPNMIVNEAFDKIIDKYHLDNHPIEITPIPNKGETDETETI